MYAICICDSFLFILTVVVIFFFLIFNDCFCFGQVLDYISSAYDLEADKDSGFETDNYDTAQELRAWDGTGFNTDYNADTQAEEEDKHSSIDGEYRVSGDSAGQAQLEADSKDDSKIHDYIDSSPERQVSSVAVGPHPLSSAASADDNDAKQSILPEMPGLFHF